MGESKEKTALMLVLKRQAPGIVAIRHEDIRRAGIPDLSTTANQRTGWWEVKFANPDFESTGIQELTCKRLAYAGFCRYIIYEDFEAEIGLIKRVCIVHPKDMKKSYLPEHAAPGFDHEWVVAYIKAYHYDRS